MCNLYSETKGQAAIRDLFRTTHDRTGNLPAFPGIFPDQLAPIVRNSADGERELVMARWGMPGPLQFGGQPVTNIRNVASPHWRGWLSARNRCLVPRHRSANTPTRSPARPRYGSPCRRKAPVRRVDTCLVSTEANGALGFISSTARHNCAFASIAAINSSASPISRISGVGEKPSSAGARTALASAGREVDW